jgi:hypothetical protein
MRSHEIETWALNVIDRVKARQPNEDQRVELKAGWIEPNKAARQIAAIANAARGVPVLWLVGVDEKKGVTGASIVDLAKWYPQVESHFDGLAPDMTPVNVPVAGSTVVALLFETERAPFVVRAEGTDRLEVPWRGSTSVRSARRDELLRILSPLHRLPDFEPLGASVEVNQAENKCLCWTAAVKVYATPADGNRIVIPFHRCRGELSFVPDQNFKHSFTKITMSSFSERSSTVIFSGTEVILNGPGMLNLNAEFTIPNPNWGPGGDARVTFEIAPVGVDRPAVIDLIVPRASTSERRWEAGDLATSRHLLRPRL